MRNESWPRIPNSQKILWNLLDNSGSLSPWNSLEEQASISPVFGGQGQGGGKQG